MENDDALSFNHAMVYVSSVDRALRFYQGILGFELVETQGEDYARLKSPGSSTTIALHRLANSGGDAASGRIRLYFEVGNLAAFCRKAESGGAVFDSGPEMMPWGVDARLSEGS